MSTFREYTPWHEFKLAATSRWDPQRTSTAQHDFPLPLPLLRSSPLLETRLSVLNALWYRKDLPSSVICHHWGGRGEDVALSSQTQFVFSPRQEDTITTVGQGRFYYQPPFCTWNPLLSKPHKSSFLVKPDSGFFVLNYLSTFYSHTHSPFLKCAFSLHTHQYIKLTKRIWVQLW